MIDTGKSESIVIDGSEGEGGGQVLRSSLGLSMVSGRPIRMERIRAGRSKPGLMRQHLTALLAACEVCSAKVTGAEIGSTSLEFSPGNVRAGDYEFRVGTAGSATLVLQTILPALMLADGPSKVVVGGGTHNPWSPPFDFLSESYLPLVNRLGPNVSAQLKRFGFYPAGGGEIEVSITPSDLLSPFDIVERGARIDRSVTALVIDLPAEIGNRELNKAMRSLGWSEAEGESIHLENAGGPGNVLYLRCQFENLTTVITSFGRLGVSAETVAKDLVKDYRQYEKQEAVLDEHLCDQWMLPLAIAVAKTGRQADFVTGPLSGHSKTHIELIKRFLPVEFEVIQEKTNLRVRCSSLRRIPS